MLTVEPSPIAYGPDWAAVSTIPASIPPVPYWGSFPKLRWGQHSLIDGPSDYSCSGSHSYVMHACMNLQ